MKQEYERLTLTVTRFDEEDTITTSTYDRNNAYTALSDLEGGKAVPEVPGSWT